MRKIFRIFSITILSIMIILTSVCSTTVYAVSNKCVLNELGLEVIIPSGYSVITRDTPANDSIFDELGVTKSTVISQFKASNIYLNAISNKNSEEIVVTMTKNVLNDFGSMSDTILNTLASALVEQYAGYGINVLKYDVYQHSQTKFIKVYFSDIANNTYGLQYYTIYDGKAMNFTIRSYEGMISSRQENVIKTVVDSIKYDKESPVANQGDDTESFVYKDNESNITFIVPRNWEQKAFSKDREYIDVKFVSTKDEGCAIIYGSTDMWSQMSASDKVGYTRSDLNNSAFTKSDIAEMYSTTVDKISTVTYNGVEYFKGETSNTSDTYGVDITVAMTQLVYIDNGWMYTFQFGGTSTHKLYSDFESLLKSVQYPTVSNGGGVGSTNNSTLNNLDNTSDDNSGVVAIVVLLIVVAVIVVAVVIPRKKNNEPTNHTPIYSTPIPKPPSTTKVTIYCTKCSQVLPLDSDFCHKCGTKIEKDNYI